MRRMISAPLLAVGFLSCGDPVDPPPEPPRAGAVIWSLQESSAGRPAFDGATVYFTTREHQVVALDKTTGAVRWRSKTGIVGEAETRGRTTLVVGAAVVVGDADVHAFARADGARLWQFRATVGYYPGLFELATDGSLVFAGSPSGHVYAIGPDGREVWRTHLKDSEQDQSAYSPVFADGKVFVCVKRFSWPTTGGIVALDAATGSVVWRRDFPPKPPNNHGGCLGQVAVAGSVVVGATDDGNIYAFDRGSGADAWSAPQLDLEHHNNGSPLMDSRPVAGGEGFIVVGSTTSWVVALDAATGAERWRNTPERGSVSSPITVGGGAAYTIGGALELSSFDLFTGRMRWRRHFPGELYTARPAVDGDRIYTGGPRHLFALHR